MAQLLSNARPIVEWGVSGRALAGELESGDDHLVAPFPGGALVALVDGLGHGEEAAEAARQAIAVMRARAGAPVVEIVEECHVQLRKTRGAVISLASFQQGHMTWLGVGNVEGLLLSHSAARESLLLRGGVVGYQIPLLRPATIKVQPGDTLLFASDGISRRFGDRVSLSGSPQQIADEILHLYGKQTDDAMVLVARYLGGAP